MKARLCVCLILAWLAPSSGLHALIGRVPKLEFRIAVLDASRHGLASVADGSVFETFHELTSMDGSRVATEYVVLPTLAPGILRTANVDLVFLHNRFDGDGAMPVPLSELEQAELRGFVELGGAVLVAVDTFPGASLEAAVTSANSLLAPFELELLAPGEGCSEFVPALDPAGHFVTDGPHGIVTGAVLPGAASLAGPGAYARELLRHPETGLPVLAVIERGALAPESGRVLVVSELDWLGNRERGPIMAVPHRLLSNAILWLGDFAVPPMAATRKLFGDDSLVPGDTVAVEICFEPRVGLTEPSGGDFRVHEWAPDGWVIQKPSISDGGIRGGILHDPKRDASSVLWTFPPSRAAEPFVLSYEVRVGFQPREHSFRGGLWVSDGPARFSSRIRGHSRTNAFIDERLRIVVLDESRHESLSLGPRGVGPFAAMREAIEASAGALGFEWTEVVGVEALSDSSLSGASLVVLHNRTAQDCPSRFELSAPEQQSLLFFVRSGGNALIVTDGGTDPGTSLLAPFLIEPASVSTGAVEVRHTIGDAAAHPLTGGPFGEVSGWTTADAGWFEDLGPFAQPVVRLEETGKAALAVIPSNALGPGSGRVVLAADANWLGHVPPDPQWSFAEDDHERLFLNALAWLGGRDVHFEFRRGDCNGDARVDISDASCILAGLFLDGRLRCRAGADMDGGGNVDLSDALWLLNFLFQGGPSPVPPFPDCGRGAEADVALGCALFSCG